MRLKLKYAIVDCESPKGLKRLWKDMQETNGRINEKSDFIPRLSKFIWKSSNKWPSIFQERKWETLFKISDNILVKTMNDFISLPFSYSYIHVTD